MPSTLQHRRTHNLLLVSKLLHQRDGASPFTLVLDSLEQSGKPLLAEYLKRAKNSSFEVVFVSFETLRKPRNASLFIEAWKESTTFWQKEVTSHLKASTTQKTLLVFDSLNELSASQSTNLPGLLSSFISPTTSLLALYHTDIPAPVSQIAKDPYAPSALTLLRYMATTIFTVHSLHHMLAGKAARERSRAEPEFGLAESIEGVLQGLGANGSEGIVLEMEHRRKSGRGVREWYFLPLKSTPASSSTPLPGRSKEPIILLEDQTDYAARAEVFNPTDAEGAEATTTFELGLTEKQKRDRDGVVLPYFDAQRGGGEGGRILYDMGEEDDFDEDEDEI